MNIVIDTNILFSFFWENSLTRRLLTSSKFKLISPDTALIELEKSSEDICNKLKIDIQNFKSQLKKLKEIVNFIDKKEYSQFMQTAETFSPDKYDTEFFALCIKENCFLWSNDSALKNQDKIKVLSTEDIIEVMF